VELLRLLSTTLMGNSEWAWFSKIGGTSMTGWHSLRAPTSVFRPMAVTRRRIIWSGDAICASFSP
jgi:hypothetical protein